MARRLEHCLHFFELKNVMVSVTNLALGSLDLHHNPIVKKRLHLLRDRPFRHSAPSIYLQHFALFMESQHGWSQLLLKVLIHLIKLP